MNEILLKSIVKLILKEAETVYGADDLVKMGSWALGAGFPKKNQGVNDEEILFSKVSDMNIPGNEKYIHITYNTISRDTAKKIRAKIHPVGTVIFPKIGGAIATNKRRILKRETAIDNNCLGIIPNNNFISEFIYYTLLAIDFSRYQTGTSVPALRQSTIEKIQIPVIPVSIQKEIIEFLNWYENQDGITNFKKSPNELKNLKGVFNKIVEFDRPFKNLDCIKKNISANLHLLRKLRQAILSEAIQGKLVEQNFNDEPVSILLAKIKAEKEKLIKERKIKKGKQLPPISKDKIPFKIPKSWEWVRLNDCVSLLGDGIHGTPKYSVDGEYYFVNGNNLSNGKIVLKENTKRVSFEEYEKHRKNLNNRTVLVSINGTIGNVAFYDNEKIMLGKSACYFNLFKQIDMNYIKNIIETKYFLEYAFRKATGTTIKNVSLKAMRLLPIPIPPLDEQKRIVQKVDALMGVCDELEKQVKENQINSEKLMAALLREALVHEA